MQYLTAEELRRLFAVSYADQARPSKCNYHLALLVALWNAPRVSELLNIYGRDIVDGQLMLKGAKKGRKTLQKIRIDKDPVLDCSPLVALAQAQPNERLFPVTRQRLDQVIKEYALKAQIHPAKAHAHAFRHSIALLIFTETLQIGSVSSYLRHRSPTSAMSYLKELDHGRAIAAVAGITL